MGDKRKFRIGQPVKVNLNHQVKADYEDGGRYRRVKRAIDWGIKKETDELVLAIVTGAKSFQEGVYHAGGRSSIFSSYGGHYEDYDPPYLTVKESVTVWAVRIGYRNKEIYFFEEDLKPYGNTHKIFEQYICFDLDNIPFFWCGWNERYRKQMSRESKDWHRDERGRWSK
jgi:hypothetical protein